MPKSTSSPPRIAPWLRAWTKDTGLLLFTQGGVTIMTVATSVIIARSLATSDFGAFSAFLGLSQALSLTIDVGLATWLLRELSTIWARLPSDVAEREAAGLLRGALRVNIHLGAILLGATGIVDAALGLGAQLGALSVGLMTYVVLVAMSTALEAGLRARQRLRLVVVTNLAEKIVLIGAVAVAVIFDIRLVGIAAAYVIAGLLRVSLGYCLTLRTVLRTVDVPRVSLASLVRGSAPFALNTAAFNFVPRLDLPLIALISVTSAGYFAIGYQVFTTLALIPVIGGSTLYPFAARRPRTMSIQRIAIGFGLAGLGAALVALALTPFVLPAVFGARYHRAVGSTEIILIALPIVFYGNGLMVAAYTDGRERQLLRRTLPGALVGSLAVLAGQVWLGVVGAAIGFGVRYVVFAGALLSLTRRPHPPRSTPAK